MLLGGSRLWFWAGSEGFEGRFYGGCGERKVPNEVAGRLWQAVGKVAKRRTAQLILPATQLLFLLGISGELIFWT